jgi:RHS repeat-associated protein
MTDEASRRSPPAYSTGAQPNGAQQSTPGKSEAPQHESKSHDQRHREPPFKAAAAAPLDLPKSGGALRGLGEKFQSGGPTGTGALHVPLPISACRGVEPQLALDYSSGHPQSPFGIGWTATIPSITRRTDKGIPQYADADESDIFIFSGQEDLVPVLVAQGADWVREPVIDGEYRVDAYVPRVEGMFSRIERRTHLVTGDVHWRSITPEDVTSYYGLSPGARIADPANPLHVFKWMLETTFDPLGNVTFYEYKPEDLSGVSTSNVSEATRFASPPANCYPKRVHYGNRTPLDTRDPAYADLMALEWYFEVVFDYGEHTTNLPQEAGPWVLRPDPFSTYRSGFEIRTYRLCERILMFHEMPAQLNAAARLVKAAELGYDASPTVTYLTSVRVAGYAWDATGTTTTAYTPTLSLDYTRVGTLDDTVSFVDELSLRHVPGGIDGHTYQFIDLDGEGIAGILTEAATPDPCLYYKRNLGNGAFATAERLPAQPARQAVGAGVQLMSLNSDGRLDVVQLHDPAPGFYERTDDFAWAPFSTFQSLPKIDWGARGVHFLDVDGDGLTDVLVAEDDVFVWYSSLSRAGFGPPNRVTQAHDEDRGAVVLTTDDYETIFLADMSGDGLSDLVRIRNGNVCYWPNLGYGRFGARVVMSDAPMFDTPDLFDPRRVRLGDIDGTGVTDIAYLSRAGAAIYFNQAGNGWAAPIAIPVALEDNVASIRVVDFLGTGTSCLVWSSPDPADARTAIRYIDLLRSTKPHLLNSIANGLGAQTNVVYAPSTQFYLEDRLAGMMWATRLPFVVQTVAQVTMNDGVTGAQSAFLYRYAHGFYDGVEREFRGFARVDAWDAEAVPDEHGAGTAPGGSIVDAGGEFLLPPIHTISYYHTGAWNGERDDLRTALLAEFYSGDPLAQPLPPTNVPDRLQPPDLREAYRSLKGRMLRQEVYAVDETPLAPAPYTVTDYRYEVRQIQPIWTQRHGVYFPYQIEEAAYHYERNAADPRIEHELTLEVDPLGHVVRSAHLAYARRTPAQPEQGVVLATCGATTYAPPISTLYDFRHGVETEALHYELAVPPAASLLPIATVDTAMTSAAVVPFDAALSAGTMRTIAHVQDQYWADDLSAPLAIGTVQTRALVYDRYALALPATLLASVYGTGVTAAEMTATAGYVSPDGQFWTSAGVTSYDAAHFYHAVSFTDPFGNTSSVVFDALDLAIVEEHTSANATYDNVTTATLDYRVLMPVLVTDPNGNQNAVAYDELGMLVATAVMGPQGANEGDTLSDPTTKIVYDLLAWETSGTPAYVHTYVREVHGPSNPGWFESYSYSDGFGREALKKTQAEPDASGNARWVGTGRTAVDNKGNVVKKYEPYFASDPSYDVESSLETGAYCVVTQHDPLSRVIRVDYPDGTFATTEWDAWSEVRSDADDTVLQSPWYAAAIARPPSDPLYRAATLAALNANTPATHVADPLGRTILSIADNGTAGQYQTRTALDIQGNELALTDPSGTVTLQQTFDAQGNALRHVSADAGTSLALVDALAHPYRTWDARGYQHRKVYDPLRRLTQLWVTDPDNTQFLAEQIVYGEGLAQPNFRGRIYLHFDGAGVVTFALYDFEGRITHETRQLATTYQGSPPWDALATIADPSAFLPAAQPSLDKDVFDTYTTYDAMSRIVSLTTADGTIAIPSYDAASLLSSMTAYLQGGSTATPIVTKVDYNARSQRVAVAYGTGVATQYTYDDPTGVVLRIQTSRASDGADLQDLNYVYDPAHNIVQITDLAQQTVYFSGSVTTGTQLFTYDPVYRITSASGREQPGQVGYALGPEGYPETLLQTIPHRNDLQALLAYAENYTYDTVGNLQTTVHSAPGAGWTRTQTYVAGSNRLNRFSLPGDSAGGPYSGIVQHDAAGNTIALPNLASLTWDHDGRLIAADLGGGGTAYFAYDSKGRRARKIVQRSNQILERVYVGNYERYRETTGAALPGTVTLERDTVHVYDGDRRFAIIETLTTDSSQPALVPAPLFRLQFGNQLGTVCLETDLSGAIISYEEYYPFGGSSYRAGDANKRYRYCAKERDEETGLYEFGARYYAPWLARWISPDPVIIGNGTNAYVYAANNPVKYNDPTGMYEWPSWKTVAVVAAVVVVGTVVTIATAGAAGPVVAAAVASIGVSGTAATVATGVVVGAVAGAAGGIASEAARTGITEGRLPNSDELKNSAISGALGGAVTGGLGAAASAARTGATAARAATAATAATRTARVVKAATSAVKAGVQGATASAVAETGTELIRTGDVSGKKVLTAALHGFVGGVAGHAASGLAARGAAAVRKAAFEYKNQGKFGPGTLTPKETAQIQALADKHNTQIDVIGSRAAGRGRNIETNLPVGKGLATRSDIDYRYDGQVEIDTGGHFTPKLRDVGGGAGSPSFATGPGGSNPPVIEFKPGVPPVRRTE